MTWSRIPSDGTLGIGIVSIVMGPPKERYRAACMMERRIWYYDDDYYDDDYAWKIWTIR
jgi:hypothetical protein